MKIISTGSKYPFPIKKKGASANFLLKNGNILQVSMPNLTQIELECFKKGEINAGFLYQKGEILWLFQFSMKNTPVVTIESDFDARIIPTDLISLHSIKNSAQRLVVDIHVIDESNILKVVRAVTMSPDLTLNFLEKVQQQLANVKNQEVQREWLESTVEKLSDKCTFERLDGKQGLKGWRSNAGKNDSQKVLSVITFRCLPDLKVEAQKCCERYAEKNNIKNMKFSKYMNYLLEKIILLEKKEYNK